MSRRVLLGFALTLAVAAQTRAEEPARTPAPRAAKQPPTGRLEDAPERLLSPTTQLYVRWDGVTAHKEAYQASIWGPLMAGPTGDSIRTLLAKGPKLLAAELLAAPLLDGKPPAELRAVQTDLKNVAKLLDLIADKGLILAAEVREPRPTIGGVEKAIGALFGGRVDPKAAAALMPQVQVVLIIPDVGDQAAVLFSGMRLLTRGDTGKIQPLPAGTGRTGFRTPFKEGDPVRLAWWTEGQHFVLYAGTAPIEDVIKGMKANAAAGGVTGHPLFQRCLKTGNFEAVTRGFVDTGAVVTMAKRLAGPFVPGLSQRIDEVGLGNLKAIVFSSGFHGRESRALWEFDLPGERKGLAKVLKRKPLTLNDLPPMPPDVSRFAALRIDPEAAYDAGLSVLEAFALTQGQNFGVEDEAKSPAEAIKLRKAYLERELYKAAGLNIREDLLPHLGDRVCLYQSPAEGLSIFGTVLCISVKDAAKVRSAADRLQRGIEPLLGGLAKTRKKTLRGEVLREIYTRNSTFLTPTYAVVGDWLVIAVQPQPVQGFILRSKGELTSWRPDPKTAARLASMPTDPIGIQFCRPESTVQNLCCIGPLFLGTLSNLRGNNSSADFDPIDVGLIPNSHELSRHLFPNLTLTRDDGKTVRIEVNESFSLPLEFIGFEPMIFAGILGLIN